MARSGRLSRVIRAGMPERVKEVLLHIPPSTRVLLAATALSGAVCVPALAADPRGGPQAPVGPRMHTLTAGEVAPRLTEAPAEPDGPYVPVVGEPDFGTADNAFGAPRSGHSHSGQDLFAAPATPVVAATEGVVIEAESDAVQGNYAYLYDPRRDRTYVYMHLVAPARVETGEAVQAGRQLGGVGCTGSCWGEHLHFEIRAGKGILAEPTDPLPELREWRSLERPR